MNDAIFGYSLPLGWYKIENSVIDLVGRNSGVRIVVDRVLWPTLGADDHNQVACHLQMYSTNVNVCGDIVVCPTAFRSVRNWLLDPECPYEFPGDDAALDIQQVVLRLTSTKHVLRADVRIEIPRIGFSESEGWKDPHEAVISARQSFTVSNGYEPARQIADFLRFLNDLKQEA